MRGVTLSIALALVASVLAPEVARAQFTPSVTPILYCVTLNETLGTADVYLGYASSHREPVTIPGGYPDNLFFPGPYVRNQPTTFLPGVHPLVFVTTFHMDNGLGLDQFSWLVQGNSVTASPFNTFQHCPHPFPVPGNAGPQGVPGPRGPAGAPGPASPVRTVTGSGNRSVATAVCSADEALVSGGGSCSTWILGSAPTGNAWSVTCRGTTAAATATAICAKK
jgi:hypothetical protein